MAFDDPFDADLALEREGCRCACLATAAHGCQAKDDDARRSPETEGAKRIVAAAVVRALFREDRTRRAFLKLVGAPTALAAITPAGPSRARASSAPWSSRATH